MGFIHAQFSNTSCSQHPPRSLGGSGGPLCTPGAAANLSPAPGNAGRSPKNQAGARRSIPRGFAAFGVGFLRGSAPVGLDQAAPGSLNPNSILPTFVGFLSPSQHSTRGVFPIKHVALAGAVLGAGEAPCSHPQQLCQEQPEPKPTGLGFPRELHNLEPWMGSLGFPMELRNEQSPEDELPGSSQQLHRGEISLLHFPGRNILQE